MADVPREPGWYRFTETGWVRVPDEVAQAEFAAMTPGYQDLVYVEYTAQAEEIPLRGRHHDDPARVDPDRRDRHHRARLPHRPVPGQACLMYIGAGVVVVIILLVLLVLFLRRR